MRVFVSITNPSQKSPDVPRHCEPRGRVRATRPRRRPQRRCAAARPCTGGSPSACGEDGTFFHRLPTANTKLPTRRACKETARVTGPERNAIVSCAYLCGRGRTNGTQHTARDAGFDCVSGRRRACTFFWFATRARVWFCVRDVSFATWTAPPASNAAVSSVRGEGVVGRSRVHATRGPGRREARRDCGVVSARARRSPVYRQSPRLGADAVARRRGDANSAARQVALEIRTRRRR